MTALIRHAAVTVCRFADWLLSPRAVPPVPPDTLWSLSGRDVSGPVAVSLWPLPGDRLGLTVTADGHLTGLRLDRAAVQALRHSITGWLVDVAPAVTK